MNRSIELLEEFVEIIDNNNIPTTTTNNKQSLKHQLEEEIINEEVEKKYNEEFLSPEKHMSFGLESENIFGGGNDFDSIFSPAISPDLL